MFEILLGWSLFRTILQHQNKCENQIIFTWHISCGHAINSDGVMLSINHSVHLAKLKPHSLRRNVKRENVPQKSQLDPCITMYVKGIKALERTDCVSNDLVAK